VEGNRAEISQHSQKKHWLAPNERAEDREREPHRAPALTSG
jgi:hypothetical protein